MLKALWKKFEKRTAEIETPTPKDSLTAEGKKLVYLLTAGFDFDKAGRDIAAHAQEKYEEMQAALPGKTPKERKSLEKHMAKFREEAIEKGEYKPWACFTIEAQGIGPVMERWIEQHKEGAISMNRLKRQHERYYPDTPFSVPAHLKPYEDPEIPDYIMQGGGEAGTLLERIHWLLDGLLGHQVSTLSNAAPKDGISSVQFGLSGQDIMVLKRIHDEVKKTVPPEQLEKELAQFRNGIQGTHYPFILSSIRLLSQKWSHPEPEKAWEEARTQKLGGWAGYLERARETKAESQGLG